jgi:hypothetical protein
LHTSILWKLARKIVVFGDKIIEKAQRYGAKPPDFNGRKGFCVIE